MTMSAKADRTNGLGAGAVVRQGPKSRRAVSRCCRENLVRFCTGHRSEAYCAGPRGSVPSSRAAKAQLSSTAVSGASRLVPVSCSKRRSR